MSTGKFSSIFVPTIRYGVSFAGSIWPSPNATVRQVHPKGPRIFYRHDRFQPPQNHKLARLARRWVGVYLRSGGFKFCNKKIFIAAVTATCTNRGAVALPYGNPEIRNSVKADSSS